MTISAMVSQYSYAPPVTTISATFVRLLFDYLEERGIDAEKLLKESRPEIKHGRSQRFPMPRWKEILEIAAAYLDDSALGLRLGQTIKPHHLGVLGYVVVSCDNLGDALNRYMRYERLFYNVNTTETEICGDYLQLTWDQVYTRYGHIVDDCAYSSLFHFANTISPKPVYCHKVEFAFDEPPRTDLYPEIYGCVPTFGHERTLVQVPLHVLDEPLVNPDPILGQVMEAQADEILSQMATDNPFEVDIRQRITQSLLEGHASLERLAEQMHVSVRTMHRKLKEHDLDYRHLLQSTREVLAREYLQDPRLELSEIAGLLGYSEQSAFSRAFKQWSGVSPSQYRRQLLG